MSLRAWRAPIAAVVAALVVALAPAAALAEPTPTPTPSPQQSTQPATATPSVSAAGTAAPTATPSASTPPVDLPLTFGAANARATMIAFSWIAQPGAAGYRLQLFNATGKQLAEVGSSRPVVMVGRLKPNTRYVAQVIAVGPDGAQLGEPSTRLTVTTPYPLPAPTARTKANSSVSLTLSWVKPSRGTIVQLEWKAPGRKAVRSKPGATRVTKSGLKAGTGYRVRLRLLRGHQAVSAWSAPVSAKTPEGDPLRVGSYNVLCANCKAWGPRRQGVADTIVDARLDVVGVQEASAATLKGRNVSQFEDLARLVAPAGYRMTNLVRFNCRNATTHRKCRSTYRGASGSVRILYNTAKVRLISTGSRQLADLPGFGADRFIAWAVFEQKINGKRFLFTSTHLEPRNDSGGSRRFYRIRNAQARAVTRTIAAHRGNLPVLAVGDYNSTKWDVPSNGPYDIMRAAGFIDPLGNSYHSTSDTSGATVEKRINTQYASYNNLQPQARRTDGVNGSNPDYIFTSKMRVLEWETVLRVDSAGRFIGTPPSDHNLIRATVYLP